MSQTAWVDKRLLGQMREESKRWFPQETGGVLMGYWSDQDATITDIIGPGPKALHTRYSFTPDAKWQEDEIARLYDESGRVKTYLGDWHSHPYGTSCLSVKDLVTLIRVALYKPARAPKPLMGILYNNPHWELVVWRSAFSKIISGAPTIAMELRWFDDVVK